MKKIPVYFPYNSIVETSFYQTLELALINSCILLLGLVGSLSRNLVKNILQKNLTKDILKIKSFLVAPIWS